MAISLIKSAYYARRNTGTRLAIGAATPIELPILKWGEAKMSERLMNDSQKKPSLLSSLPAILNTPVPLPKFLVTPISFETVFGSSKVRRMNKARQRLGISSAAEHKRSSTEVVTGLLGIAEDFNYAIAGRKFSLTETTWIFGEIIPGQLARVTLAAGPGGNLIATKVVQGAQLE